MVAGGATGSAYYLGWVARYFLMYPSAALRSSRMCSSNATALTLHCMLMLSSRHSYHGTAPGRGTSTPGVQH